MWDVPLNAVIGDKGFIEAIGRAPSSSDSEDVRIQHHLEFVVKQLRESGPLLSEREYCLELLEAYARAGRFPKHTAKPATRTPIFVDRAGTPCAVAHLMLETGASELCKAVDQTSHFSLIEDMLVDESKQSLAADICAWADSMALTPRELAMIQPMYSERDQKTVSLAFALSGLLYWSAWIPCIAGLVNMVIAYRTSCPLNGFEWTLAILGILHCTIGVVAWAIQCYIQDFEHMLVFGYSVTSCMSMPVVLVVFILAGSWNDGDATPECTNAKNLFTKVTWGALGVNLVVWCILAVYFSCCHKFKSLYKRQRNKVQGQGGDADQETGEDDSSPEEKTPLSQADSESD
eukprot:TRINITY_DN76587_c0_g1_i1.p1 TRINITY_DN76587_c0_g1~~TRINITY_DN76587_c0_g1_i1.p1  ORF type:complete len:347 (-),score=46.31 TRINITY_DN76587_c0_g1_i1:305-1345(-)